MGQRTEVWVEATDKQGNVKNYLYYQQWGYGMGLIRRLQTLSLNFEMQNINETIDTIINKTFSSDVDLLKKEIEDAKNIKNIKQSSDNIKAILSDCVRNDGYLIIKVKEKQYSVDIEATIYVNDDTTDSLIPIDPIEYLTLYRASKEEINYVKALQQYQKFFTNDILAK